MNRDLPYLVDIAKLATIIMELTANMNEADFQTDLRTQHAILYEITVIGEIVKRLSTEFRERHTDIAWKQIAGMRDRLIHDYDGVKASIVWQVIQIEIPALLAYITPLLPEE